MEKKRAYQSLQAVRAIAAMMVVLHHAATFVGLSQEQSVRSALEDAFSPFQLGVEIFFVLSGFVIYTAHSADINQGMTRLKTYLWKRVRRIYPIYWIVLVPVLLSQMVRYEPLYPYHRNPLVILSSFLLVHIGPEGTNLTVAWTLFHEVMFYLFFGLLLISKRAGIVLFAIWLVPSVFFWTAPATYWSTIFSPLHLLFLIGIAMAWCLRQNALSLSLSLSIGRSC